jgi:hypothetical protein
MFFGLFEMIVEILFMYKNSKMYLIHIALMCILFGIHIYFTYKKKELI